MTKNKKEPAARSRHVSQRRISIRSVRRSEVDTRKLARALIAIAQAEAAAEQEHIKATERGSKEVA